MSRTIANFKLYDDDKLALVCSHTPENQHGTATDSISLSSNHPSHLIMINFKSLIDSPTVDQSAGHHTNINFLQSLKDVPAKLTVDGRRNLIAVVCQRC